MSIRISWDDKELVDKLNKITKDLSNRQRKNILRKGANIASKQLKQDTPVDSGDLKSTVQPMTFRKSPDYFSSFKSKKAISKKKNKEEGSTVDPFYAAFLNEGFTPGGGSKKLTKHKGFIQESLDKAAPRVLKKIEEEVKKVIQQ